MRQSLEKKIVLTKNKIITKEKNGINYPKYLKNLPKWR